MEVLSEKNNELFGRKEVIAKIGVHGHTPSRKEVVAELLKKYNCDAKCISVRKVEHKYGRKVVEVTANIYPTPEDMARKEPKHQQVRTHGKEEKK